MNIRNGDRKRRKAGYAASFPAAVSTGLRTAGAHVAMMIPSADVVGIHSKKELSQVISSRTCFDAGRRRTCTRPKNSERFLETLW
jgi:hypothetical protein